MSESEGGNKRADSPRRRARAAAAAAAAAAEMTPPDAWPRDDAAGGYPAADGGYQAPQGLPPTNGYQAPSGYEPTNGYQAPGGYEPTNGYQAPSGYEPTNGYQAPGGYEPTNGYQAPGGYEPTNGYQAPGGYDPTNGYQAPGGYEPTNGYQAPGGYEPTNGYQAPNGYDALAPQTPGYAAPPAAPPAVAPAPPGPVADYAGYTDSTAYRSPAGDPSPASSSPYGNGTSDAGSSPYGQPSAGARSPYEDYRSAPSPVSQVQTEAPRTAPPLPPAPSAPQSPMNGSTIGYGQATFGGTYTAPAATSAAPTPAQADPMAPPDPFARTAGYPSSAEPTPFGTATPYGAPAPYGASAPVSAPDAEQWPGASTPTRRSSRAARTAERPSGRADRSERSGRSAGRTRAAGSSGTGGVGGLANAFRSRLTRDRSDRHDGGRPDADRREPQTPGQAALSAVTEVVVVLSMALALSLVIKTFLMQAFFIPSQSMQDTLQVGDRVLVSKLTPGPLSLHRGDVVVFKDPGGWLDEQPAAAESPIRHALTVALTFVGLLPQDSGEHLIKRVIGLPGDTVMCCDAKGRLQVNGTPIDETYVRAGNKPSTETFTVTVKADHLWVMGDNRSQSFDSRFHRELDDGQVPTKNVVGKAFVVVWPFSRFGGVDDPPPVFARVPDPPSTGAK